jgi:steroid delta-isomerase-like uncharacterized protein
MTPGQFPPLLPRRQLMIGAAATAFGALMATRGGGSSPLAPVQAAGPTLAPTQRWAAYWSSHDMDRLLSIFTDDCVYEDVTLGVVNHGKAELAPFARGFFTAFPDLYVEIRSRFNSGDRAAVEWSMSGTHEGDLMGTPPTQNFFLLRGASAFELQGDKIRRCSDYWDIGTFTKQLGLST